MRTTCIVAIGCAVLFGCASNADEEAGAAPATIQVPGNLTNAKELVGSWRADVSKQQMKLDKDGVLTLKTKVTIGAANTQGRTMDTEMVGKWGVSGEDLYYYGLKNSDPIRYKWKLEGGKLILDSGGRVKLAYSRE